MKRKRVIEKLREWSKFNGNEELDNIINELEEAEDEGGEEADDNEDDDGSNPPGGPGTPP